MLGALAGWVGTALFANRWVALVGGLVIVLFGLHMIGLLKIGTLYRDTRKFSNDAPRGVFGSFALGLAFAAGWTPCIGPILGGILAVAAATDGGWQNGLLLTSFYAAGLSVPFLLTGLGINKFLSFYSKFRQHLHKVEVFSGVLLILIGSLIAFGYASRLSVLAQKLPNPENFIVSIFRPATTNNSEVTATTTNATTTTNKANARPAPDVEFTAMTGTGLKLSDLRGQVVLVNFWATWCGPCRAEIPVLNAMQREFESQGFKVVGVSWDDTAEMIRDFETEKVRSLTQSRRAGKSWARSSAACARFPHPS
jgi:thiol:disulfide interchange protein